MYQLAVWIIYLEKFLSSASAHFQIRLACFLSLFHSLSPSLPFLLNCRSSSFILDIKLSETYFAKLLSHSMGYL